MPSRPSYRRNLLDHNKHHRKTPFLTSLLVSIASVCTALLLLLLLLLWFVRSRRARRSVHVQTHLPDSSLGSLRQLKKFTYRELKKATKGFDETHKLGKGGYGVVYRGLLRNGEEVAVKKLVLSSLQGEREFQNELAICTRLESRYVVKLLGFASHGANVRLLVYECMQNKSLQEVLLEKHTSVHLNWEKRFGIILDIARALAYLHLECRPPIIHGDVKPSNVLLDGDFRAYLADFGLARTKTDDQRLDYAHARSKSDVAEMDIGTPESMETRNCKSFEVFLEKERRQGKVVDVKNMTTLGDQSLPSSCLGSPHSVVRFSSDVLLDIEMMGSTSASPKNLRPDHSFLQKTLPVADHCNNTKQNEDHTSHLVEGASLDQSVTSLAALQAAQKASNKDNWWWKQENSGELKVRDYVIEWMRSELCSDQNQRHVAPAQQGDRHEATSMAEAIKEAAVKKRDRQEQRKRRAKSVEEEGHREIDQAKRKAKARATGRKGREWWKDEYFAELNKKNANSSCAKKESSGRGTVGSLPVSMDRSRFSNVTSLKARRLRGDSMAETVASDDLSSTTTSMRGTVCYVAPEFGGVGVLSEASDMYSFGVLLLVIVSGRRPLEIMTSAHKTTGVVSSVSLSPIVRRFERANLITWARNLAYSGNVLDLIDDRLHGAYPREQAQMCILLALLCIRRHPSARPTIGSVVKMLLGDAILPPLPVEFSPSPPSRLSVQQSPLGATSCLSSSEDMI